MPELPEVHTTVEGLKKVLIGKTIKTVWSDFHIATSHGERQTIKNKKYFESFKKKVIGSKIIGLERRGKNILIHLSNKYTFIIHMKMTGHLMYGKYRKAARSKNLESRKEIWKAEEKGPLQDPYNRFLHFVCSLSDGKHLVLSDTRKFASITITETKNLHLHESIRNLGHEPLDPKFKLEKLLEIIKARKSMPIKSALLDQSGIAGIGNIYSDEILWKVGVHPLSKSSNIPNKKIRETYDFMRKILKFSINKGGDSKSDYRNALGEKGSFQNFHKVYGKKGGKCPKKHCSGIIERIVVRGRSAHFCPKHQIKYGY